MHNKVAFVIRRIPHYRVAFYKQFVENNSHLNIQVYFGTPEAESGGSGLIYDADYPFAKQLRSFGIGPCIFQRGLIKKGLISKYNAVVFEGSLRLVSSFFILFCRKIRGKKNIIWLKGWPDEIEKNSKFKYIARKIYLSLADAFVTYGYESLKSLKAFNVDESKITVVQNTVDVSDLISKQYLNSFDHIGNDKLNKILTAHKPFIYNIGRIIQSKKVDDIVTAFRMISNESIGSVQLVIAGDGPDLDQLIKKVDGGKPSNIHILGKISDLDSKILFANCLFCVFPGAVGLSLNEAMAAGKAVICADEPGPDSELLIHEFNGLRFQKGNISALAECMRKLLADDVFRNNIEKKAFETISQKATMGNMVNKFTSAVNTVLSKVK